MRHIWILLGVCAVVAGCGGQERDAIESVLAADEKLRTELEVGVDSTNYMPSTLLTRYVVSLRQLDLRGCPEEFARAYQSHIASWDALAKWLHSNEGLGYLLKGFISRPSTIENERLEHMGEVRRTWLEVQRVAQLYGVDTPNR